MKDRRMLFLFLFFYETDRKLSEDVKTNLLLNYFNSFENPYGIYFENSSDDYRQELFFISASGLISNVKGGEGGEGRRRKG